MLWLNLREEEFRDAVEQSNRVCVLPIGCIEKHGQHMPLGTDYLQVSEFCRLASEQEPVCVFPPLFTGEKSGSGEFNGTVMYSPELRLRFLEETCDEIHRNGFDKILIASGHGGNADMLKFFLRSCLYHKKPYQVFFCGTGVKEAEPAGLLKGNYSYLTEEDKKILQDYVDAKKTGGHACFTETGRGYAMHPELIRLDKMDQESGVSCGRFDAFAEHNIVTPFTWMANYPNSYSGHYHPGLNERIGRAMVEACVTMLVDKIRFLKTETISDEYYAEWKSKQSY